MLARTRAQTHTRTHARTHTRTRLRAGTQARTHARTHACMLARSHAQSHTRTHARTHTRRRLRMRATHLFSGFLAPMLSFDPAVQDFGEVSWSLSVSEPKSAADKLLLDMVVGHCLLAHSDARPQQNPRICGSKFVADCKTRFLVAGERDFDFGGFKMIINPLVAQSRG